MNKDDIAGALSELVAMGDMELAGLDANGEPTYRLTEQGKRRAEAMPGVAAALPSSADEAK